jgi:hypothetical protein
LFNVVENQHGELAPSFSGSAGKISPVFSAFFGCFLFFALSARARLRDLRDSTTEFIL